MEGCPDAERSKGGGGTREKGEGEKEKEENTGTVQPQEHHLDSAHQFGRTWALEELNLTQGTHLALPTGKGRNRGKLLWDKGHSLLSHSPGDCFTGNGQ